MSRLLTASASANVFPLIISVSADDDARAEPQTNVVSWQVANGRSSSTVNRPAGGPMLLDALPNAELVMTSHTGHWMQWERADLFNQLVTEFLSPDSKLAVS